jgi:pleuromutilin/lincosamide/streptogramin A transport system ATP-binding/permease protein
MILLEALNVKYYVEDHLLLDIDQLHIQQKDRIGLVGRNGCGKTTLLNIIAKNIIPEEGTIIQRVSCELLPQLKRTDTIKSGGEVTQKYIQKTLVRDSELLLADEPTTNLDTDHTEWLEKSLKAWQGALVIVSHDRAFLDALCTIIWEIDDSKLNVYTGNYSSYLDQKEAAHIEQQHAYESYEKKKRQLEEALRLKERKAQKAIKKPKNVNLSDSKGKDFGIIQKKLYGAANAIETRLEKLEKVEKVKEQQPLKMNLPNAETFKNRIILRVEDVSAQFGEHRLWHKASFFVRGGDKLAIIGPNGSGKTTLLKKIMNHESGLKLSPSVKIAYFSQNLNILDEQKSIIENVRTTSKQEETLIRTVLARMHFYQDDVYKPVEVLSGGERVKVALTKLFLSDMNTLILDEPTNYLDMEAVDALESLLKAFEGSVVFVSHDRRFIETIATRIVDIRNQRIRVFEGTYRQFKNEKPKKKRDFEKENRLVLETKIAAVLGRLSIETTPELEEEFQRLLKEKRALDQ